MLQFENGQFQSVDEKTILPEAQELGWDKAIKAAGFEDWQSSGEEGGCGLRVAIYRRYTAASGRIEWLVDMDNALGGISTIYCASEADFMPLFLQLGPLMTAAMLEIIAEGLREACKLIEPRSDQYYGVENLFRDLVKKR